MSKFKVGDKVRRVSGTNNFGVTLGNVYEVTLTDSTTESIKVKGVPYFWSVQDFELVPTLDQEKDQLEKRLAEVKRLIKERDKPKGMVMLKDGIKSETVYFFVCTDRESVITTSEIVVGVPILESRVNLGMLFYDRKSAEQRLHDLKQETLLKQK